MLDSSGGDTGLRSNYVLRWLAMALPSFSSVGPVAPKAPPPMKFDRVRVDPSDPVPHVSGSLVTIVTMPCSYPDVEVPSRDSAKWYLRTGHLFISSKTGGTLGENRREPLKGMSFAECAVSCMPVVVGRHIARFSFGEMMFGLDFQKSGLGAGKGSPRRAKSLLVGHVLVLSDGENSCVFCVGNYDLGLFLWNSDVGTPTISSHTFAASTLARPS